LAANEFNPVVLTAAAVFFCVESVIFLFAEKLVNVASICAVLLASDATVFDSSIPLKE
jgi:hypothetical protein